MMRVVLGEAGARAADAKRALFHPFFGHFDLPFKTPEDAGGYTLTNWIAITTPSSRSETIQTSFKYHQDILIVLGISCLELTIIAEQSRAEQSRAEQSRAEQSRAEQSRAEQSKAPRALSGS
jgi:hypothetical protein